MNLWTQNETKILEDNFHLSDVAEYARHDLIECLECGKWFPFSPVHINRIHQIDTTDYKRPFQRAHH